MDNGKQNKWTSRTEALRTRLRKFPKGTPSRDDEKAKRRIRSILAEYCQLRADLKEASPNESSQWIFKKIQKALGPEAKRFEQLGSWHRQGKAKYKQWKRKYDKTRAKDPQARARRKFAKAKENKTALDRIRYLGQRFRLLVGEGGKPLDVTFWKWARALQAHWQAADTDSLKRRRRGRLHDAYRDYAELLRDTCHEARTQDQLDLARKRLQTVWSRAMAVLNPSQDEANKQKVEAGMARLPTTVGRPRQPPSLHVVTSAQEQQVEPEPYECNYVEEDDEGLGDVGISTSDGCGEAEGTFVDADDNNDDEGGEWCDDATEDDVGYG
ncbi:MAG: hypothetical protein DRQ55_20525 [Planctomycetota bacterium]|nr:MAG: hypothetical protein DRQ55_20525 [Planctomycetota bacterium]